MFDNEKEVRRTREIIVILIALVALIVAILAWLAPFNPIGPSPFSQDETRQTNSQRVEVKANVEWQTTGIQVETGQLINLQYVSGTWSECPDYGCDYYDAGAKDRNGNIFDDPGTSDNVISECPGPVLIARISNNSPFCIGSSYVGTATQSGNLQLRINDAAIDDNGGSVVVIIEVK